MPWRLLLDHKGRTDTNRCARFFPQMLESWVVRDGENVSKAAFSARTGRPRLEHEAIAAFWKLMNRQD